jgi:hypothetical protein
MGRENCWFRLPGDVKKMQVLRWSNKNSPPSDQSFVLVFATGREAFPALAGPASSRSFRRPSCCRSWAKGRPDVERCVERDGDADGKHEWRSATEDAATERSTRMKPGSVPPYATSATATPPPPWPPPIGL